MQLVAPENDARCNASGRRTPYTVAQELGIHRSSLKRYLDQYPELLGTDGKVDLDQLRRHRADNPNVADAARKVEARSEDRPKLETGRVGAKSRLEEARAKEAELDLAERLGQLVDPGDMLDAVAEAANLLREKFAAADPVLCERLASETDPRQIKVLIEEENRRILAEVQAKFAAIASPKPDEGQ